MSQTLQPLPGPAFDTAPLTMDELVMCRRYMGYPAIGGAATGMESWRFFQVYGFNEYRMNNLSPNEYAQTRAFLSQCQSLEAAVTAAGANLDTDQAAVWTHNKNEVADRRDLYDYVRRQLCDFLGTPPGPGLQACRAIIV